MELRNFLQRQSFRYSASVSLSLVARAAACNSANNARPKVRTFWSIADETVRKH